MFNKNEFLSALFKKGINQGKLSKILSLNKSTVSKKVNGKSEWTLGEIEKIAEVVGEEKISVIFFSKIVS